MVTKYFIFYSEHNILLLCYSIIFIKLIDLLFNQLIILCTIFMYNC